MLLRFFIPLFLVGPEAFAQAVVTIDGMPIFQSQIENQIFEVLAPAKYRALPEQAKKQVNDQALQELITEILLVKAAATRKVEIEGSLVETELTLLAKKHGHADKQKFLDSLGAQRDSFMEALKRRLQITALINQLTADLPQPSIEEALAYYNDHPREFMQPELVRARHIVLYTKGLTDPAQIANQKAKAEGLKTTLDQDQSLDFATLAKVHSEGPRAQEGGDLGAFPRGKLLPALDEVVFAMAAGQVSEVIQTPLGYHLLFKEQAIPSRKIPFQDVKKPIQTYLHQMKRRSEMNRWIEQWTSEAIIIYPDAAKDTQ